MKDKRTDTHYVKLLITLSIFLIVAPPSCMSFQKSSKNYLKKMKASEYFTSQVQVQLAEAINKDKPDLIDVAVEAGADVNYVGKEEMVPLMWALVKDKKNSFKKLLELGANPNFKTKRTDFNPRHKTHNSSSETSVMVVASIMEDSYYLSTALKYGGKPNLLSSQTHNETLLFEAIQNHRIDNVKILLDAGANINHQSEDGSTPIFLAKAITRYDLVYLLMQRGADLKHRGHRYSVYDDSRKLNQGPTLGELIDQLGDGSIKVLGVEKEQREWYNKVVAELKRQGLME